jgi:hypothetical protein
MCTEGVEKEELIFNVIYLLINFVMSKTPNVPTTSSISWFTKHQDSRGACNGLWTYTVKIS